MSEIDLGTKKKKKAALDLGDTEKGVEELGLAEKPKKKKKKLIVDLESGDNEAIESQPEKKKKSKKAKVEKSAAGDLTLDLTEKKRPKKKPTKAKVKTANQKVEGRENQMAGDVEDKADFGYESLLDRVFKSMAQRGIGKGDKETQRYVVKPPKMSRMGTKRTVYENFGETCADLSRDQKHVMNYILAELGATGNITEKGTLIIRGKFTSGMMEKILKPYIKEYVLCKTCKRPNTVLTKTDRLTFMECQDCSSKTTVTVTKKGFEALTGKRKRIKMQQGGAATLAAIK